VERLEAPVWVAWAKRDKVVRLDLCRPKIAHRLSTFNAGHTAFLEQPDAFAHEFESFADHLPPRLKVASV
jgi:4,5:9,10-diseco-3-hydroxy-5,9,17-trioxoandrosta-1(10),2-diene-4-oate hydrolase